MDRTSVSVDSRFKVLNALFVLGLLFASFDIVLNVEVAGMTFRTAQIAQALFVVLHFATPPPASERKANVAPLGFKWLIFWAFFIVIWTPNTFDLTFSIAYTLYFIFAVVVIFVAVQVYGRSEYKIMVMLRAYLTVFVFVASFGLLQFVAGVFGVDLLVRQWWKAGLLPRLNGFSYEPSYYATYLITGWGMLAWMIERRIYIFKRYTTYMAFGIVSAAIVLSSSRMAILIIGIYFLYYFAKESLPILTQFRVRKSVLKIVAAVAVAGVLFSGLVVATSGLASLQFLLFGTGLAGSADHSATMRIDQLDDTISLIKDSPFIGYGLGGVVSYIARMNGQDLEDTTGMNITAEVFAASGLFGFVFFVLFIATIVWSCFRFLNKRDVLANHLAAAGVGFILLYLILQFNQNIMRVYFWNHVAVISVLYCQVNLQRMKLAGARHQDRVKGPALSASPRTS